MTAADGRRAFFFPHARVGDRTRPGRHPFDVTGMITDGERTVSRTFVVFADGRGRNVVGCNQDPCIFSAPLGPFLAYCRIDKRHPAHALNRDYPVRLLSEVVRPRDLIFFGKYVAPGKGAVITSVWIDTVLVVDRVELWPAKPGTTGRMRRFTLPPPFLSSVAGRGWRASNAFRFNLRDTRKGGSHERAKMADHRVIVGRRDTRPLALSKLATSFVPLAATGSDGAVVPVSVSLNTSGSTTTWKEIRTFISKKVNSTNAGAVAEMPWPVAVALYSEVIRLSGTGQGFAGYVAIPPLSPAKVPRRRTAGAGNPAPNGNAQT